VSSEHVNSLLRCCQTQ